MRKFLMIALICLSTSAFAETKTAPMPAPRPTEMIDINHASASELASLKGVGPSRAADIIKGRPYNGKDDLRNRNIIPASVYSNIHQQIVAKQK